MPVDPEALLTLYLTCLTVCVIIMYLSLVYSGFLQAMFLLHTAVEVEDLVENSLLSSHSSAAAVALDGTYGTASFIRQ